MISHNKTPIVILELYYDGCVLTKLDDMLAHAMSIYQILYSTPKDTRQCVRSETNLFYLGPT